MSTQYDTIQAPYDEIRKTSISLIERANVQEAVAPFIKDARVLELACGSGFYSYEFLKWGANKVVGIDISSIMLDEARAAASSRIPSNNSGATIDFQLADCMKPAAYEGGPFNLVFGAWMLNYAPSGKDMVDMFRNVALNLQDGGYFVGVTPPPTQDPAAFVEAERKARPSGSGSLLASVTGAVEDGITFHVHADTRHGDVDFDCYHLRKDVYEASAREGGLRGELTWSLTSVPDEFFKHREGGASVEELESYRATPNYGILVIAK